MTSAPPAFTGFAFLKIQDVSDALFNFIFQPKWLLLLLDAVLPLQIHVSLNSFNCYKPQPLLKL